MYFSYKRKSRIWISFNVLCSDISEFQIWRRGFNGRGDSRKFPIPAPLNFLGPDLKLKIATPLKTIRLLKRGNLTLVGFVCLFFSTVCVNVSVWLFVCHSLCLCVGACVSCVFVCLYGFFFSFQPLWKYQIDFNDHTFCTHFYSKKTTTNCSRKLLSKVQKSLQSLFLFCQILLIHFLRF